MKIVARCRQTLGVKAGLFALGLAAIFAQIGGEAAPPIPPSPPGDALPYSRSYLVTGDYAVGGVDTVGKSAMGGFVTSSVPMSGVPANADIIAAYLYWETIWTDRYQLNGVQFRGTTLTDIKVDADPAKRVNQITGVKETEATLSPATASCLASGGGSTLHLSAFRADVLHLLPKRLDATGNWTGLRLVNDIDLPVINNVKQVHTLRLPDSGSGNGSPTSSGASLMVVYRDPTGIEPLRKIVVYDGAYAQAPLATTTQSLRGFLQSTGTAAKVTAIGGSGTDNTSDRFYFDNKRGTKTLLGTDLFKGSSDRGWSQPTRPVSTMPGSLTTAPSYGEEVAISFDHSKTTPYDCQTFAAFAFSTAVKDDDHDGLPDRLEDSTIELRSPPVVGNPNGAALPRLKLMGASSLANHKDIFIEINALRADTPEIYGSATAPYNSSATPDPVISVTIDPHTHTPPPEALKMIGDAYASHGITPHFDVGSTANYLGAANDCTGATPHPVCPYLVPTQNGTVQLARGGETILERACDANNPNCQFPDFAGTVGWKTGFELFRDAPVSNTGGELTTAAEIQAWKNQASPRRRFDTARRDLFHYVLYAHARGNPRSLPCLENGFPGPYDKADGSGKLTQCIVDNPSFRSIDYRVPTSASGVADLPGGNVLITVGLWDKINGTGTPFLVASTTLHEIGHNLGLGHGGLTSTILGKGKVQLPPSSQILTDQAIQTATTTAIESNCKPNYLSSMSYLFQVHGLIDALYERRIDYSTTAHTTLNENAVVDGVLGPRVPLYQPTWFAPANSALASLLGGTAATRLCNGVKLGAPPNGELTTQPTATMVRVWAPTALSSTPSATNIATDIVTFTSPTGWSTGSPLIPSVTAGGLTAGVTYFWRATAPNSGSLHTTLAGAVNGGAAVNLTVAIVQSLKNWAVPVDWTGNNVVDQNSSKSNVNFDGVFLGDETYSAGLLGFDDWGAIRLDQISAGKNLVLNSSGALWEGGGSLWEGGGSLWEGGGSLWEGGGQGGELDFETAKALGRTPPSAFHACVLGGTAAQNGCVGPWQNNAGQTQAAQPDPFGSMYHRTYTTWKAPTVGTVAGYLVYRVAGATVTGSSTPVLVCSEPPDQQRPACPTASETSFVDEEELPNNEPFTYYVKARFNDDTQSQISGASNFATITAVNDRPVAVADSFSVNEDLLPTLLPLTGNVLANDIPANAGDVDSVLLAPDRGPFIVNGGVTVPFDANGTVTYPTAHGSVVFSRDGSFTYTPVADFNGVDGFSYKIMAGTWDGPPAKPMSTPNESDTVGVVIVVRPVNDTPTAASQSSQTLEDTATALAVTLSGGDVETAVSNLAYVVTAGPSHGTLTGTGRNLAYTPAANYNGVDSFTFTVSDRGDPDNCLALAPFPQGCDGASKTSAAGTVTIVVHPVNDMPTASAQTVTTDEDIATAVVLTANDVETALASLNVAIVTQPSHGTLNGTWPNYTYTPTPDFNGVDSFAFTVTDRGDPDNCSPTVNTPPQGCDAAPLTSAAATIAVTVRAVNDAPTAAGQNVVTNEDTAAPITLAASDLETPIAALTSAITIAPLHGTLSGTWPAFTYTPNADYFGPDSFSFTVTDRGDADNCATLPVPPQGCSPPLTSAAATVTITVTSVNDQPSFNAGTDQTVNSTDGAQTITGWASAINKGAANESTQILNFIVTNDSASMFTVQPAIAPDGTLTYTPAVGVSDKATVIVTLHDDGGTANGGVDTSAPQTFTIRVITHTARTYVVKNKDDAGAGSLRRAIDNSNANGGVGVPNTIEFNIIGNEPFIIRPTSQLPVITVPVVIDGTTQPEYATFARPVVTLNGADIVGTATGLVISAGQSTVRGLTINQFAPGNGISLQGAGGNTIQANRIGTNRLGEADFGNQYGIDINAPDTVVGGVSASDRNIISGNNIAGINVNAGVTGTLIQGNYIGLNAAGTTAIANPTGIAMGGTGGTIGGTATGARNVISGNGTGLNLGGSSNTVAGNYIGTNGAGAVVAGLENGFGFQVSGNNNIIGSGPGGTTADAANVIGGNGKAVFINGGSSGNSVIANTLLGNGFGIDLAPTGATANDPGDVDTGVGVGNNGQNFPAIGSAVATGATLTASATLNSSASTSFRIDFYANATCGTSGGNAGPWVGSASLTTDASGNGAVTASFTATTSTGYVLTATATDPAGNTSESSACTTIVVNHAPTAQSQAVSATTDAPRRIVLSATDPDAQNLTYTIDSTPAHGSLHGTLPNVTYISASGYVGQDTFTFHVNDGYADSNTATVDIQVNPPSAASMSQARTGHTATKLADGRVLVTGGDNNGVFLNSAEIYDPQTDTWTAAPPMASARGNHTATLLSGDRVLVTGGSTNGSGYSAYLETAEIYNAATNTWTVIPSMGSKRTGHTATLLTGDRVLVAGGADYAEYHVSAEIYDATTSSWSTTGSMAQARYAHSAVLLPDGTVLVAGGLYAFSNATATAEVFTPGSNSWSTVGPMGGVRASYGIALAAGSALAIGGQGAGGAVGTADQYNAGIQTWSAIAPLAAARLMFPAVTLTDGRVAVAGGYDGTNSLDSLEVFDPGVGTWSTGAALAGTRHGHTMTVLGNGSVLVVGGTDAAAGSLASVEIKQP
jgi:hypothetical protein